ncbi:odorant receptor 4-like [Nymphalis io]|uniref:odorant receptor 4-like n=1 Tax=Inachis io TaxID=171585 RepID=UPI0021674255|nr:odorant receptor 4-like [Nymphalis io]
MAFLERISGFVLNADLFDFNIKYLTLVGLWPQDDWEIGKLRFYKIYEVSLHILSIAFITVTGIGTYQHKHDITILMTNLDKALAAYNFVFKIFFFVIKRKQLNNLIIEIRNSGDEVSLDRRNLMVIHVIMITLISTGLVTTFSMLSQLKGEMTVEAWMPFDPFKNRMSLLLAGQILAIYFVVPCLYRAFAIQGIVCSIVMYFCDQLIELQEKLKSLSYTEERERIVRNEFKNIIKKHVRIMSYSKTFTSIFKEFFLIQNLAVTIELCLNALMVTVVSLEEKTLLVSFIGYLGLALINAYIFCYLGNELIVQSTGIAQAAYESGWTSWPIDMQKDLLILIRAAQRPLILSAGGMTIMCIQTYSQALYNAYSIFAVLNDVVD